jgi:hypothetical protein
MEIPTSVFRMYPWGLFAAMFPNGNRKLASKPGHVHPITHIYANYSSAIPSFKIHATML